MTSLVRLGLSLVAILAAAFIIAAHGVRGIIFLVVLAAALSIPQTRSWKAGERVLVRIAGSRQRAAALVLGLVIVAVVAVNVYDVLR